MNEDRLTDLIERPDVQKRILKDYTGGFSLGITLNPENRSEIAIRVRVEGEGSPAIPSQITLDGDTIPIIVNTNFKLPVPLKSR
jgi:hypothetical protein